MPMAERRCVPLVAIGGIGTEEAESRCIRLVINDGMAYKFALIKCGLNYKSTTPDYHRLRRKISKKKKEKQQKIGLKPIRYNICHDYFYKMLHSLK